MSKFDDFNARVERTKAEADASHRNLGRPGRDGFFDGLLGGLLGEFMVRVWWFFLLVGGGVGLMALGLGVSFSTALTLALGIAVGIVVVMSVLSNL